MRVRVNRNPHDQGAVAIIVAVMALVLIALAAFTLDFGMAYSQRRALSTGVDSAALAIVRENYDKVIKDPDLTCSELKNTEEAAAQTRALTQVNANKPFGMTVPASALQTPVLACVGAGGGILQATVTASKQVDTILGGLMGVSTLNINTTAVAALGVVNEVGGYLPIAVCTNEAQAIVANGVADGNAIPPEVGRREKIELDKVWKPDNDCGPGGAGNWGWLFCTSNGVPGLADNIKYGCANPLVLNPGTPPSYTIDGTTGDKGNSANILTAMQSVMDKQVAIPVYDSKAEVGANTEYHVIGFLSVRLCGFSTNSKDEHGTCYSPGIDPISAEDVTVEKGEFALQVQFVEYTPAGSLSEVCALGDKSCAFNAYVTRLIK